MRSFQVIRFWEWKVGSSFNGWIIIFMNFITLTLFTHWLYVSFRVNILRKKYDTLNDSIVVLTHTKLQFYCVKYYITKLVFIFWINYLTWFRFYSFLFECSSWTPSSAHFGYINYVCTIWAAGFNRIKCRIRRKYTKCTDSEVRIVKIVEEKLKSSGVHAEFI